MMRVPVLHGTRSMSVEEQPRPEAGPGEVVVQTGLCGICGSDLHLYDSEMAPPGIVMGHEFGGTIVDVGPGVERWDAGQRVVAGMPEPCGNCWFCRRGERDLCYQHYRIDMAKAGEVRGAESMGAGGYGPFTRIAVGRLLAVPEALDDQEAACVEPAAVGFHAVQKSGMALGDSVVVLGAGPIGLFTLQCAIAAGAGRVLVVEPSARRAQLARELGAGEVLDPADTDPVQAANEMFPGGPDVVFDAAGVKSTLQQSVDIVKPGGHVMMVGVAFEPAPIKPSTWVTRRITVRAAFAYSRRDYEKTMELMEQERIVVAPLISSIVGVDDLPATFERLLKPNDDVKVLVDPAR
jgi:(R,R)-butanediol dehydrogenase / meso-butanediol dehydrogenase / diacetyl reductase